MGLNVADITCALTIILHSFKMHFFLTPAACCLPISGPVYSCYFLPCRWSRQGSLFHSQVCSWSVGWQSTWGERNQSPLSLALFRATHSKLCKRGSMGAAVAEPPAVLQNSGCPLPQGFRWFDFQASKNSILVYNTNKVKFYLSDSQPSLT
jgi:hypothetical protein